MERQRCDLLPPPCLGHRLIHGVAAPAPWLPRGGAAVRATARAWSDERGSRMANRRRFEYAQEQHGRANPWLIFDRTAHRVVARAAKEGDAERICNALNEHGSGDAAPAE